ncbi:hypothetical protein [Streptomyces lichenis]|uniref:GNAT family N-acetyltransferase n=1 Tax=Streptomyces lichenis TaxID=2306967 RepID=A0ABT0IJP7_9ACTN|nr:hypothetical protein [Streptomyces lichenis]MCK8681514.1 hypothetical protein [Streptomyces lichenis]
MGLIRNSSESDLNSIADLLASEGLGPDIPFCYGHTGDPSIVVAERDGRVVGVAEYSLDYDFGRLESRADHPGGQGWKILATQVR